MNIKVVYSLPQYTCNAETEKKKPTKNRVYLYDIKYTKCNVL